MTHPLRYGLPPLPQRMKNLPVDHRGFPVPHFVAWVDGVPDHRIVDAAKLPIAIKRNLCWMCGQPLGVYKTFCIGPMCAITRTISEPPSHLACVRFAAQACPFLTRPHAKRREAGLPDEVCDPAGLGLKRNPGAVCLWTTKSFRPYRHRGAVNGGNDGILFELGDPEATEWYVEGRPATREEIEGSIVSGLPALEQLASQEGKAAMVVLNIRVASVRAMLDRQFGLITQSSTPETAAR